MHLNVLFGTEVQLLYPKKSIQLFWPTVAMNNGEANGSVLIFTNKDLF